MRAAFFPLLILQRAPVQQAFGSQQVQICKPKSKPEPTGGILQISVVGKCEVRTWTSKALEKSVTDVIFEGFFYLLHGCPTSNFEPF